MLLLEYGSQNKALFESLQAHTCGKVRWQALDEREEAWDTCRKDLIKLQEEAHEVLSNILNEKSRLIDRIAKGSREKDVMKRMVEGVLYVVWDATLNQEPNMTKCVLA